MIIKNCSERFLTFFYYFYNLYELKRLSQHLYCHRPFLDLHIRTYLLIHESSVACLFKIFNYLKNIVCRKDTCVFKIMRCPILVTHTRSLLYQQAKTSLLIYIPNAEVRTNTTAGGSSNVNIYVTCCTAYFCHLLSLGWRRNQTPEDRHVNKSAC